MASVVAHIHGGGKIVIPAAFRHELGLKPGDAMVVALEDGTLRLIPRARAVKEVQRLVRQYVNPKRDLASEVLEERRAEAMRENRRTTRKRGS